MERLKGTLVESVLGGRVNLSGSAPIFNVRQREALQRSLQSIQQTMESVSNNESYEFVALDLRTAIDVLGEIVGEVTTEDILSKNIFRILHREIRCLRGHLGMNIFTNHQGK